MCRTAPVPMERRTLRSMSSGACFYFSWHNCLSPRHSGGLITPQHHVETRNSTPLASRLTGWPVGQLTNWSDSLVWRKYWRQYTRHVVFPLLLLYLKCVFKKCGEIWGWKMVVVVIILYFHRNMFEHVHHQVTDSRYLRHVCLSS